MTKKWKCPDCGELNPMSEGKKICIKCDAEMLPNDELEIIEETSEVSFNIETSSTTTSSSSSSSSSTSTSTSTTTSEIDEADEECEIIEEVIEGYWICPKCETRNKGSKQGCSACGAVRGENVEFFCDDDAPVITDEKELEAALSGPDWICEFCSNTSPASAKNCTGCGSPRSQGKKRKETEETIDSNDTSGNNTDKNAKTASQTPSKPLPAGVKIGCGILALLVMIFGAFSCSEKEATIQVTAANWQRVINTEKYNTYKESAWKDRVPAKAKVVSTSREIRRYNKVAVGHKLVDEAYTVKVKTGTKKVKVGRVNKGNGRFVNKYAMKPIYKRVTKHRKVTRTQYQKVPVYESKVVYMIDRWKSSKGVMLSGKDNSPKWPEFKPIVHNPVQIGDIRKAGSKETYSVTIKRVGVAETIVVKKLKGKSLTLAQFQKLKIGSKWKSTFSRTGTFKDIILDPNKKK